MLQSLSCQRLAPGLHKYLGNEEATFFDYVVVQLSNDSLRTCIDKEICVHIVLYTTKLSLDGSFMPLPIKVGIHVLEPVNSCQMDDGTKREGQKLALP